MTNAFQVLNINRVRIHSFKGNCGLEWEGGIDASKIHSISAFYSRLSAYTKRNSDFLSTGFTQTAFLHGSSTFQDQLARRSWKRLNLLSVDPIHLTE